MEEIYIKNSKMFKSFSDPNRLKIIEMLSCGEMCACTILEKLNITQPTLSHHMKKLEEADLIKIRKDGLWSYYSLNKKQIKNMMIFMLQISYDNDDYSSNCN